MRKTVLLFAFVLSLFAIGVTMEGCDLAGQSTFTSKIADEALRNQQRFHNVQALKNELSLNCAYSSICDNVTERALDNPILLDALKKINSLPVRIHIISDIRPSYVARDGSIYLNSEESDEEIISFLTAK